MPELHFVHVICTENTTYCQVLLKENLTKLNDEVVDLPKAVEGKLTFNELKVSRK